MSLVFLAVFLVGDELFLVRIDLRCRDCFTAARVFSAVLTAKLESSRSRSGLLQDGQAVAS